MKIQVGLLISIQQTLSGKTMPTRIALENIVRPLAQQILLPGFGQCEYVYKDDGSIVTKADLDMQQSLERELLSAWPEYKMLGEEMTESEQEAVINSNQGYWCIDPLDGTNNYASGLPFFAVSIALIIEHKQVLGFIYDPLREEVFFAEKDKGASLNGERLTGKIKSEPIKRTIAEIDMKRLPVDLATRLVTEEPYGSQRNIGSSALDWCWLAAGRYNVYLHGGQMLWDYAAGNLILRESGGQSVSLDGESVFRGKLEVRSALASLDASLFDEWVAWIKLPIMI